MSSTVHTSSTLDRSSRNDIKSCNAACTMRAPSEQTSRDTDTHRQARSVRARLTHQELGVVHVVEPRVDGHGVVRVEQIRSGRVVDDDHVLHLPPELGQVLCACVARTDERKRADRREVKKRGETG